jgi:hypothetical protein
VFPYKMTHSLVAPVMTSLLQNSKTDMRNGKLRKSWMLGCAIGSLTSWFGGAVTAPSMTPGSDMTGYSLQTSSRTSTAGIPLLHATSERHCSTHSHSLTSLRLCAGTSHSKGGVMSGEPLL